MELGPVARQPHDFVDVIDQAVVHANIGVVANHAEDFASGSNRLQLVFQAFVQVARAIQRDNGTV